MQITFGTALLRSVMSTIALVTLQIHCWELITTITEPFDTFNFPYIS